MLGRRGSHSLQLGLKMINIKRFFFFSVVFFASTVSPDIITQAEILDLELISRNTGEQGGIIENIDYTITSAGHESLKKLLCSPITKIDQLKNRQSLIKALQEPELASKIQAQLSIIKQHEQAFSSFFNPERRNQLSITLKKNYYQWAKLQGWNESAIALDFAHLLEFCALFGPLLEHLILHYAVNAFMNKPTHQHTNNYHHHHEHDDHCCEHHHDDHDHHHHIDHHHHHDNNHEHHDDAHTCIACLVKPDKDSPQWKKNLAKAVTTGHLIFHIFNIKEMVEHLAHKADVIDYLHQEIISINACIKASATIGDLLAPISSSEVFPGIKMLSTLCDTQQDLVMQSLSNNFSAQQENHLGIFSRVGPTLAAYQNLGQQEPVLMRMLHAAGTVDALLSVATLLEKQSNRYTFAEYRESTTPYIEMENFVHPQLTAEAAVPNSIILSHETGTGKILITGPNKAGKSSIGKALPANLVLAQTIGVVAASKGLISPMHRIIMYITIHDNLSQNESTFLAEIMRVDKALQELQALEGKAPSFALFDDSLFRSTQPKEGEIAAYRFAQKIISLQSTLAVFISHFEKLSILEREGTIKNYHIELIEKKPNYFASTFKITPGISPRNAIFSLLTNESHQSDLLS